MAGNHHLVRSLLVAQVAEFFMRDTGMGDDDALRAVYGSPVAALLDDDAMGLYGQSALYLYGLMSSRAGED